MMNGEVAKSLMSKVSGHRDNSKRDNQEQGRQKRKQSKTKKYAIQADW
jgi:hypothetical protein